MSVFHFHETCEGKVEMHRPYQFRCSACNKGVHVMDSNGLSEEDLKIFEEVMKNGI